MRRSDTSGDEMTRDAGRSLRYGKLSIAGFSLLDSRGRCGGVGSGRSHRCSGIRRFAGQLLQLRRSGNRFHQLRASEIQKYKFKLERDGVTINVGPGPSRSDELFGFSTNDVNVFEGNQPDSFGIVRVRREGGPFVTIEGQFGVLTDGGVPLLDGINQGNTFAGVEIDVNGSDPLDFTFCGVVPFDDGVLTFG